MVDWFQNPKSKPITQKMQMNWKQKCTTTFKRILKDPGDNQTYDVCCSKNASKDIGLIIFKIHREFMVNRHIAEIRFWTKCRKQF
jgi:hypothetical protein